MYCTPWLGPVQISDILIISKSHRYSGAATGILALKYFLAPPPPHFSQIILKYVEVTPNLTICV